MVPILYKASGGRIILAFERGERVIRGEKVRVEVDNIGFDVPGGVIPAPIVIFESFNPISSSSIEGERILCWNSIQLTS